METNYIDAIIEKLLKRVQIGVGLQSVYALLVLTKGQETTLEDVHNAWAVSLNRTWNKEKHGQHYSMIPFNELKKEVQDKDQKYVDAIHEVAKEMGL